MQWDFDNVILAQDVKKVQRFLHHPQLSKQAIILSPLDHHHFNIYSKFSFIFQHHYSILYPFQLRQFMLASIRSAIRPFSQIAITLTQHPTNPSTASFKNQQLVRPFLWNQVRYYQHSTLQLINNLKDGQCLQSLRQLSTWYDFDRHQDEREGIFIFMLLANIQGILRHYFKDNKHGLLTFVTKIELVLNQIQRKFETNQNVNSEEYVGKMTELSEDIDKLGIESQLFNPKGFNAHYRISSDDLRKEAGREKIVKRIQELKHIEKAFGRCPVSEIIIADCESVDDMNILSGLLDKTDFKKVKIVPLIENDLPDSTLQAITDQDINKVMFAGSDSIMRQTYVGALKIKLKIQDFIVRQGKKDKIAFFEGTGSRINRNGNMIWSRMGTILEGISYERTIQGRQRQVWATDPSYMKQVIQELINTKRCTQKHIQEAFPIIDLIYQEVCSKQKLFQKEPAYTDCFNKQQIFDLVNSNCHSGSRTTKPTSPEALKMKNQRAIMQSFVMDVTGFHPELLYWENLKQTTLTTLIKHLDNPILQDLVNQYTCLLTISDSSTANLYLNNDWVLKQYQLGMKELAIILSKIRARSPKEVQEKLLLFKSSEQILRVIFDASHLKNEEISAGFNEFNKKRRSGSKDYEEIMKGWNTIYHRVGIGFCTSKAIPN